MITFILAVITSFIVFMLRAEYEKCTHARTYDYVADAADTVYTTGIFAIFGIVDVILLATGVACI